MDKQPHIAAQQRSATPTIITSPGPLSPDELESYRQDGFVVPRFRLSDSEVSRLRDLMFKLVTDNPTLADKMMNLPHIPGAGSQGLKSSTGWMEFAAHPAIIDMIEQIVGPDIILRGSAAFYKRAGNGPATPWHRDSATLPIKPLHALSVWIAVSDAKVDNACLRFIPGSHRNQSRGKHRQDQRDGVTFGLTLDESEYDESTAADVEIEAGQMVIFDVFTIHGSRSNLGTRERAGYAVRFMPATSRYEHDAPDNRDSGSYLPHSSRPLILLRGVDRACNDFRRGHPTGSSALLLI